MQKTLLSRSTSVPVASSAVSRVPVYSKHKKKLATTGYGYTATWSTKTRHCLTHDGIHRSSEGNSDHVLNVSVFWKLHLLWKQYWDSQYFHAEEASMNSIIDTGMKTMIPENSPGSGQRRWRL
jgi:hypothetical protein